VGFNPPPPCAKRRTEPWKKFFDTMVVVSYLDVDKMAQETISLLEDASRRVAMGHRAMEKVRQRHDVQVSAPKILGVMEKLL
jgi:spore maturation protein CgeB